MENENEEYETHRSFVSKKALTKVQAAVIAVIIVAAVVAGVAYYLSLSASATNLFALLKLW